MNKVDTSSCWYQRDSLYKSMNDAISKHPPLEQIGHGKVLISLVNMVDEEGLKFLDCGTGGALSHTIVKKSEWTGCDLEHVIENVSKKCFPNLDYFSCDLINEDLTFMKDFDILLFNAILDIMEQPLLLLDKILKNSKKYVIIHRQDMLKYIPHHLSKQESYGGFTYHTMINREKFNEILKNNNFIIKKEEESGLGLKYNRSFLLKKDD